VLVDIVYIVYIIYLAAGVFLADQQAAAVCAHEVCLCVSCIGVVSVCMQYNCV
jgi:hypothetical protein